MHGNDDKVHGRRVTAVPRGHAACQVEDSAELASPTSHKALISAGSTKSLPMIQTPIYAMLNPETGSRVTLLGDVHVATVEYYQTLTDELIAHQEQGTVIHLEAVLPPSEKQLAAASAEERELLNLLATSLDDGRAPALGLGLVAKRAVWISHPDWEIHDITMLDSVVFLGADEVRRRAKASRRLSRILRLLPRSLRRSMSIALVKAPADALRRGESRDKFVHGRELELHRHRESVAMAAVDRHLANHPGGDIALLWGALHLPGFRDAFGERGYKDDGEQWITAIGPEPRESASTVAPQPGKEQPA